MEDSEGGPDTIKIVNHNLQAKKNQIIVEEAAEDGMSEVPREQKYEDHTSMTSSLEESELSIYDFDN
jgi:hypothetical protein